MKDRVSLPGGIRLCKEHAVYCRDDDALAIADLHLGYEASLQAEHVAMPRFQLGQMKERLATLISSLKPETLVINGDMKHGFERNSAQEWDEVDELLGMIGDITVIIVRGNHDNYLKTMLARRGIQVVDSLHLPGGDITFSHGHAHIERGGGLLVLAHEHPVVRLRDSVGARLAAPCFLHDEAGRLLLMPAFSPLASGTDVLSPEGGFMCPDLRKLDLSGARVYAVQGSITDLGTVGGLRGMRPDGER